jgi:hypothetical protein
MPYGKNEADLQVISAFRRGEQQFAKTPPRVNGKSRLPAFITEYTPSATCIDTVRLVSGDYAQDSVAMRPGPEGKDVPTLVTNNMPFIQFTKHFDGYYLRGCTCSAGPFRDRDHRKPCHGCDIFFATAARNETGFYESTRMSKQLMYAFSVWDYGMYHNAPQTDKQGVVKMGPQNKPYMQWQKCIQQGCPHCRAGNVETKQGIMRSWPLNSTQYKVLTAADKQVGRSCVRCFNQNCINGLSWITSCCHQPVIDMRTTNLTAVDIAKLTLEDHTCQQCRVSSMLIETYECGFCVQRGQTGVRASLFDVDLNVMTVAGANNSKTLQVCGWSAPNVIPDTWKAHLKPMDLLASYAADSLEFQAKMFQVQPTLPGPQPQMQPQGQQQMYVQQPVQGPPQQPQYQPQQVAPQYQPQQAAPQYPPPQQPQYAPPMQQPPQVPPAYAPQQAFGQPTQAPQGYPQQSGFGQPGFGQQGFGAQPPPATPYGPRR